jgi:hypothetical protein
MPAADAKQRPPGGAVAAHELHRPPLPFIAVAHIGDRAADDHRIGHAGIRQRFALADIDAAILDGLAQAGADQGQPDPVRLVGAAGRAAEDRRIEAARLAHLGNEQNGRLAHRHHPATTPVPTRKLRSMRSVPGSSR